MYAPAIGGASPTERIVLAGREVFLGRRRGLLAMLPFVGPAVIASIAYMEPRNFATISRLTRNIVTNFWGSRSAPISMQCHECRRVSVARGIELKMPEWILDGPETGKPEASTLARSTSFRLSPSNQSDCSYMAKAAAQRAAPPAL